MNNIHIYYHVALIGNYEEIVKSTINKLTKSDLYESSKSINICLLRKDGLNIDFAKLNEYPKIKIIYESNDITEFEYPTLNKLYEHATIEDAYFLYIHTKGVNPDWIYINQQYLSDWRNLMEYFTIENWRKCVELLEKFDTVGVNFGEGGIGSPVPRRHYSGNFWWSKSSYLRTLEKPKITKNRFEHEAWIGTGKNMNHCSLHSSNVNHYQSLYPRAKYEVK